jgi:hypothetical protein
MGFKWKPVMVSQMNTKKIYLIKEIQKIMENLGRFHSEEDLRFAIEEISRKRSEILDLEQGACSPFRNAFLNKNLLLLNY